MELYMWIHVPVAQIWDQGIFTESKQPIEVHKINLLLM